MKAAACVVALLIIRKLRRRRNRRSVFDKGSVGCDHSFNRGQRIWKIYYEINYRMPQFLILSLEEFEHIHTLVEPFVKKMDTHWRTAITSKERLAITLQYLATGDSYSSLQYTFHVSKQTISTIIPEVCDAVARALKDMVQLPVSEQHWKAVSKDFEEKWNFPHTIGALDGKHNYSSSFS